MPTNQPPRDLFHLLDQGGNLTVVEINLPETLDPLEFDRLNDSLLTAIDANPSGSWLLDLAGTAYMGSAVLGLLVNLRQRIKTSNGQLALCCLTPALMGVFRVGSLHRLFTLCKTRDEALHFLRRN